MAIVLTTSRIEARCRQVCIFHFVEVDGMTNNRCIYTIAPNADSLAEAAPKNEMI